MFSFITTNKINSYLFSHSTQSTDIFRLLSLQKHHFVVGLLEWQAHTFHSLVISHKALFWNRENLHIVELKYLMRWVLLNGDNHVTSTVKPFYATDCWRAGFCGMCRLASSWHRFNSLLPVFPISFKCSEIFTYYRFSFNFLLGERS